MRRHTTLARPLAPFLALLLAGAPAGADDARRLEWTRRSDVVFDGVVIETGRSNVALVKSSGDTSLVQVTQVHEKPAAVRLKVGDVVTVHSQGGSGPGKGGSATFYATGWIFADSLAVKMIAYEALGASTKDRSIEVKEMRKSVEDAELGERIRGAPVVVLGRVAAIEPAPGERAFDTEHDPQWQDATIEVEAPIKGAQPGERLKVRFAASDDVRWFRAPKLRPDQRGVLILLREEKTSRLLVVDPGSVLAAEEFPRVRTLAARQGGALRQ